MKISVIPKLKNKIEQKKFIENSRFFYIIDICYFKLDSMFYLNIYFK